MVALPQVYNVADLPDTGGSSVLIPEGSYQAVILNSELKSNSKNTGSFLALTIVITQGQYANTELIERLNIIHSKEDTRQIAYKTLARISESLGMATTPQDSSELHNKPLVIEIKNKKSNDWVNDKGETVEGREQSEIKKYKALPATGIAPQPTAPTPAPQSQGQAVNNPFAT